MGEYIDIVFDGPPSHESPRFVEVESPAGRGIRFGEWIERPDGFWALRFDKALAAAPSPEWVKTSERLPTQEDADECEFVWAWDGEAEPIWWGAVGTRYEDITHWMPKPRQQPPEPPGEGRPYGEYISERLNRL